MDDLVLVNRDNPISRWYVPDDLVIVDENENNFHKYSDPNMKPMISKRVLINFLKLQKVAFEKGFNIIIDSGYRSYDYQNEIWYLVFNEYLKSLNIKDEVGDYKENYPISHYTTTVTTIISFETTISASATEISFEGFTDNGGCTPPQSKSCPEVSGTMWSVNPNNGNDYNLTNTTCAKIKKTGNYYVYPQKTSTVSICEHFKGKFSVSN